MARLRISYKTDELENLLEARIRQGQYEIDSRLPTERELSKELSVARGTIRKAYRALHHKGIVNYLKRSYYVKDIQEPYEFEEKQTDAYGVFFSKSKTQDSLLIELETTLRNKGLIPVCFNLDGADTNQKDFSIFNIIHLRLKGAFFISNIIGLNEIPLNENHLEKLPFPYLFVGVSPLFEKRNYIETNSQALIEKCGEFLRKRKIKNVQLCWPWPIDKEYGKWLSLLSKKLDELGIQSELTAQSSGFEIKSTESDLIICTGLNYEEMKDLVTHVLVLGDCLCQVKLGIQVPLHELVNHSIEIMVNELTNCDVKSPSIIQIDPKIVINQ